MSIARKAAASPSALDSLGNQYEDALVKFIELSKREGVAAAEHAAKIGIIAGVVFISELSGEKAALGILRSAQGNLMRT